MTDKQGVVQCDSITYKELHGCDIQCWCYHETVHPEYFEKAWHILPYLYLCTPSKVIITVPSGRFILRCKTKEGLLY